MALLVSGLAQAGDAVVGATHAQPGMVTGSTVAAPIQLTSSQISQELSRVSTAVEKPVLVADVLAGRCAASSWLAWLHSPLS